jgi:CheY-like chemotaxis protein
MKKILVVESSRPVQGLSGALFRRRECVLEVASTAAEALAKAEADHPDLVIHDELVADMSVEDFVQALGTLEGAEEVPVLVVLDDGHEDREGPLLRAGAAAVVFRSTDEIALNSKVCELLGISLRRHLRTFVKMKVDATIGGAACFATIANISLGGALIETDRTMRRGDVIKLAFFLPGDDDAITVISKVIRDESGSGPLRAYGCQFLDLTESARHRIHAFVTDAEGDD